MYGYTMHIPAPIEAYQAMHEAVVEVADEEGSGEGLLLHLAYATDRGFALTEVWETKDHLDAFNRVVMPKAMVPTKIGPPLSPPRHWGPATVIQTGSHGPPQSAPGGAKSVSVTSEQL